MQAADFFLLWATESIFNEKRMRMCDRRAFYLIRKRPGGQLSIKTDGVHLSVSG